MPLNFFLAFAGGAVTVLVLEALGLSALLEPYRNVIDGLFGIFGG